MRLTKSVKILILSTFLIGIISCASIPVADYDLGQPPSMGILMSKKGADYYIDIRSTGDILITEQQAKALTDYVQERKEYDALVKLYFNYYKNACGLKDDA